MNVALPKKKCTEGGCMRLDWKGHGLIFGMFPSAGDHERIRQASRYVGQWYSDLIHYHNALRAYSADDGRFPELADCVVRFWMRWHALEHGDPSCEHVQSWRMRERNLRTVSYTHLTLPTIYSV